VTSGRSENIKVSAAQACEAIKIEFKKVTDQHEKFENSPVIRRYQQFVANMIRTFPPDIFPPTYFSDIPPPGQFPLILHDVGYFSCSTTIIHQSTYMYIG